MQAVLWPLLLQVILIALNAVFACAEIAVISVGRGNWYGHPRAETMERLRSCGASIYRTDENGTVTIRR